MNMNFTDPQTIAMMAIMMKAVETLDGTPNCERQHHLDSTLTTLASGDTLISTPRGKYLLYLKRKDREEAELLAKFDELDSALQVSSSYRDNHNTGRWRHDVDYSWTNSIQGLRMWIEFPKTTVEKVEQKDENKEMKECSICFDKKISTVFTPCGHAIACKECALKVKKQHKKCSICNQEIKDIVPLYY